jgi:ribosomal protein S18
MEEPLAHPFFGFSELGGVGKQSTNRGGYPVLEPNTVPGSLDAMMAASQSPPRLSPTRIFYPGQTYTVDDLNPFNGEGEAVSSDTWVQRPRPMDSLVRAQVDYKDRRFLSGFLSEMGQLLPRRRTKLKAKTHRKIMRAVKLARCMALLPPTAKLPQYAKQKNPYTSRTR